MEPVVKEKFFIVIRSKSRKGFCRGVIGRVEGELQNGELMAVLFCGSSNNGNSKTGGIVKKEDTYPLTRHQAQLLLYVSSLSKRLELLCNPQFFSAICELSHQDLVVVRHKKGHLPGLVKNLMQIGRNDNQEDLHMLGFEVEILETDRSFASKKSTPPPLFSAADIVQVVPSQSVSPGVQWNEGQNHRTVSRINSTSSVGSFGQQVNCRQPGSEGMPQVPLEVGSLVEVQSNSGLTVYGVIRWIGALKGKTGEWAGIELDYDVKGCSDGTYGGKRFFTCSGNKALFIPKKKCCPDRRFGPCGESVNSRTEKTPVPSFEESEDHVPPLTESEAFSVLVGKMKGIQGHINSCYLDATLFSLFCSSLVLDKFLQKPLDIEPPTTSTLRKIINRLRRQGFVPAESVMSFRKELGCDTFSTEEKDPEEFITVLFQKVLCIGPLLKLRSRGETFQDTYTLQIFLEKEQMCPMPTAQQLLDTSCLSSNLKFEVMPSCLIVQMPRFGSKYKMFSHIIPSVELDITDLLYNCPRQCFLCGCLAEFECLQCLPDRRLAPGRIKQYCATCNTQVHTHPTRQGHSPTPLEVSTGTTTDAPMPRHTMQLFAVLCIQTSHYVSFVKCGSDPKSWLFFDCMADRCGNDQSGYNIPEVCACPELGDFLSQSEEELACINPSQVPELVRRLLCDSYMLLYQKNPVEPLPLSD
ncbi:ubiquitin carboxyl-terminal hydrolase CYLD [Periophthalmus magnuspinnatus]|uniref:ubiquitin carboxyl-terminal hydrolase CYLD n=1 Tax=Periophthalmus magnuspinnatus TaxID=409849 RepID=UPI00145B5C8A|nr:ubiquitin carboxyl-terminal hydrolase CYLD [Periophthalmus magnuspinnatus]